MSHHDADSDTGTHDYAGLDPDTVLAAVETLGRYSDGRLLALNSYENRVLQIGIDGQAPMIGKFYRPERWSDEAIMEEHAFAAELADHEVPIVGPLEINGSTIFAMAWLVLVLSIGAIMLLMYLIREGAISKVASLFYLVPACTAVFAWILFGEELLPVQILGMAITSFGVALATMANAKPAPARTGSA